MMTLPAVPMHARSFVLRSLKYDNSLNYSWPARVLWEDPTGFIWHAPAGTPFTRPSGVGPIRHDWVGRVWYDRWYLIDASLVPVDATGQTGVIDHYYCNIARPGLWDGDEFCFVDLDLDALVYPDGRVEVVDEDELAAHTIRFGYPAELVAQVRQAAAEAIALSRAGEHPFDGTLAAYHRALHSRRD